MSFMFLLFKFFVVLWKLFWLEAAVNLQKQSRVSLGSLTHTHNHLHRLTILTHTHTHTEPRGWPPWQTLWRYQCGVGKRGGEEWLKPVSVGSRNGGKWERRRGKGGSCCFPFGLYFVCRFSVCVCSVEECVCTKLQWLQNIHTICYIYSLFRFFIHYNIHYAYTAQCTTVAKSFML